MKRLRYILTLVFAFVLFTTINTVKADQITFFEDIGNYSIAVAGNNNAYRGTDLTTREGISLITNYPSNWDTIKNNIPSNILSRINNMSGSYLEFDGTLKKAWLSTMLHEKGTADDLHKDVLLIHPDGTYQVIYGFSKQTCEINISQSGWYYVSILDALFDGGNP